MSTPAKRVEWTCPGCGKRYAIPAHMPEPRLCPQCRNRGASLGEAVAAEYPLPSEPAPMGFPIDVEPPEIDRSVPEFEPPTIPLPTRRPKRSTLRKRYPILRTIALCYKVLAAIVGLGAIVGIGISITATTTVEASPERTNQIIAGLVTFGAGVVLAILFWTFSEVIHLLLDIEETTRRAAKSDNSTY
ncbi:MAG: hypothetical protein WD648_11600 [Planctomycetaceae bacterium]